jgi:hypothetical protein
MRIPLAQFVDRSSSEEIDVLAKMVTAQSLTEVRKRLSGKFEAMAIAEARGYVRARAYPVIHRRISLLAAQTGVLQPAKKTVALQRALEQTVQLVVRNRFARPQAQFAQRLAG